MHLFDLHRFLFFIFLLYSLFLQSADRIKSIPLGYMRKEFDKESQWNTRELQAIPHSYTPTYGWTNLYV